jgi:hypothetical protein
MKKMQRSLARTGYQVFANQHISVIMGTGKLILDAHRLSRWYG